MKILIVGGSGYVSGLIMPYLAAQHTIRIFDLYPPREEIKESYEDYHQGDVGDPVALRAAMEGINAVLFLAMGEHNPQKDGWHSSKHKIASFDVNVKGVYLTMETAHDAGIQHAVYASSLSVYQSLSWGNGEKRYYVDEDLPADAQPVYGFTKRLGEEVCRNATRAWGMSINALRLCLPMPEEKWLSQTREGEPTIATVASDVANAFLAALELRAGFQIFHISGDYEEKLMRLTKAKQLLHWEPLARPKQ